VNSLLQVITTLAETTHYTDSGPSESVSKTEIRRMILHLGAKKTTNIMGQALYTSKTEKGS